jgi:triosephosphate isomerase
MKTAKLIAGNWKMNGQGASLGEVEALRAPSLAGCHQGLQ